jgi:hypothetical protein
MIKLLLPENCQKKQNTRMDKKRIRLDEIEKKVPFEVPNGYFENLPSIIQSRIPPKMERNQLISWSWQRSVSLVAAVSLIVVLAWISFPTRQGPLGQPPLSEVSDAAILEYLADENLSYYDLSENNAVQNAFDTDSTIINYLDGVDKDLLLLQLDDSFLIEENI